MNLRKRTLNGSTSSSSAIQPCIRMEFYRKNQSFNYDVWKSIFDFLDPYLIHLMLMKPPLSESSSSTNVIPLLPIKLLISWNNLQILDEFKNVLLSFSFRKTLANIVARLGNYETMLWFQRNGLTLNQSVLVSAAQRGDIELFDKIWKDFQHGPKSPSVLLHAYIGAAQFGHLDLLKIFAKCNFDQVDTSRALQAASKSGQLKILEWYYEDKQDTMSFEQIQELFTAAVEGNKMNVLLWLKSFLDVLSWDPFVRVSVRPYVSMAARHGSTDLVMWLMEQGFRSDHLGLATAAAAVGNIDLLNLVSHRQWSEDVYTKAAEKGHLALLQWAKENAGNNSPWPKSKMFPAAAESHNVELYQWLFDQECPFQEEKSFINALKRGHFDFIKFARSRGSDFWNDEFYFSLLDRAATLGDLETMKWAREQQQQLMLQVPGTRIDSYTSMWWDAGTAVIDASVLIEAAATGGHLHTLEDLSLSIKLDNKNDSDKFYAKLTEVAARYGHVAILEWALVNNTNLNTPYFPWAYRCFLAAIKGSQFKVLVWLKTHFPDILTLHAHPMLTAAEVGDIEVFKWLRNNGMKWHPMTCTVANQCAHFDIAEWAVKNGCPKDEHSKGRIQSTTNGRRLELSRYVEDDEEQEGDEDQEDDEEQEDNVV